MFVFGENITYSTENVGESWLTARTMQIKWEGPHMAYSECVEFVAFKYRICDI